MRALDLAAALAQLSPQHQSVLSPSMLAAGFNGYYTSAQVQALLSQTGYTLPQLMTWLLPAATAYAQPSISAFQVGAVALGLSGGLYFGANLEFMGEALIYTVHAEQAAIVNAWVNGEQGVTMLAVSAAPCGYCRQFLWELVTAQKLQILIPGKPMQAISYYLPDAFGPNDLGVTAGLLAPRYNKLVLDQPSNDPLTNAALAAANRSYAPYTSEVAPNIGKCGYAGVALQTSDGSIFTGAYAENAAYNPAMEPLEAAIVQLVFCNHVADPIRGAVLAQGHVAGQRGPNQLCDQENVTRNVLTTGTIFPLTVVYAHQ
jgi:cytidine deaminase